MSVTVRPAVPADAPLIHGFVRALADYEKLLHEVDAREADIAGHLFGDNPRLFCDIAEADGKPVGFAIWFYNYSTFRGRHGIYLEDLFVREEGRGTGAGRALMAQLARRCLDENLARIEWAVQGDNLGGQAFYRRLGARPQEHAIWRLDGEALEALAR